MNPPNSFEASRHPMQSIENTLKVGPVNLVHYGALPVNLPELDKQGFDQIFAAAPPAARSHQLFLADDAVVQTITEKTLKCLRDLDL